MKRFVIVCEADSDARIATTLADRVVTEQVEWINDNPSLLDTLRRWQGLRESSTFLAWRDVSAEAAAVNLRRIHGHFQNDPGSLDAAQTRRVLRLIEQLGLAPDAVVLTRDSDGETDRLAGMRQGCESSVLPVPLVVGVAQVKRECWVLAGFDPQDSVEQRRLDEIRQEIGYDPRLRAEELTAKHDHDKQSSKRVLKQLVADDYDRECRCWRDTSLETLRERGERSGLRSYLDEVSDKLVPLFS